MSDRALGAMASGGRNPDSCGRVRNSEQVHGILTHSPALPDILRR